MIPIQNDIGHNFPLPLTPSKTAFEAKLLMRAAEYAHMQEETLVWQLKHWRIKTSYNCSLVPLTRSSIQIYTYSDSSRNLYPGCPLTSLMLQAGNLRQCFTDHLEHSEVHLMSGDCFSMICLHPVFPSFVIFLYILKYLIWRISFYQVGF